MSKIRSGVKGEVYAKTTVRISPIFLKSMREDNNSWKLPSNRGWNNTSWHVRDEAEIEGEKFLLVEVVMTGRYWNRFKFVQNKGVDYAREYSLVMPQVWISVSRLKDLLELMVAWHRELLSACTGQLIFDASTLRSPQGEPRNNSEFRL